MKVVNVANVHEATWDAARRMLDPVQVRSDNAGDQRLRFPTTYVVQSPLDSTPMLGNLDPFTTMSTRIRWTAAQVEHAEGLLEAAERMREGDVQVTLAVGDLGHVTYQCSEDGDLESMVIRSSYDLAREDLGLTTMLTELVANAGGMMVGRMWYVSPAVCSQKTNAEFVTQLAHAPSPRLVEHKRVPLVRGPIGRLASELCMLAQEGPVIGMEDPFIRRVAGPIYNAHRALLNSSEGTSRFDRARELLSRCESEDWREACTDYINHWERAR